MNILNSTLVQLYAHAMCTLNGQLFVFGGFVYPRVITVENWINLQFPTRTSISNHFPDSDVWMLNPLIAFRQAFIHLIYILCCHLYLCQWFMDGQIAHSYTTVCSLCHCTQGQQNCIDLWRVHHKLLHSKQLLLLFIFAGSMDSGASLERGTAGAWNGHVEG